ncbi:hypothetical protein FSARC_12512 [Fusarium sarcochroum]|uniref:Uncharacterized protein n=1 Tax=Fusarium sarcochroum TaxID=1208366 RepID=A0A8H4T819_9HYPO|nr:hypothetical protein FSARC_12512 [Fusarium sarcochroum]
MLASQTLLAFGPLSNSTTSLPGYGEVNVFYTYAQISDLTVNLADLVPSVWRGPETDSSELRDNMKDVHWHAAGIGFGVRGSNIPDVISLFEETINIYRKEAPDAKFFFNYNPLTFLWSVKRYFPLSSDCKDEPGKDLGYITICKEACT